MGRGDRPLQVSRVYQPAANRDLVDRTRCQVPNPLTLTAVTEMLVASENAGPTRRDELRAGLGEVLTDFIARSPLVVAGVLACQIDAVLAQGERVHAVVRGR